MASRTFSTASSFVPPWLTQPGTAGQTATHTPSSSRSRLTKNFMTDLPFLPDALPPRQRLSNLRQRPPELAVGGEDGGDARTSSVRRLWLVALCGLAGAGLLALAVWLAMRG